MIGNFHVRFLGGKGAVMPPTYPAENADWKRTGEVDRKRGEFKIQRVS